MLAWWWRYKVETCSCNKQCQGFVVSTVLFHLLTENWTEERHRWKHFAILWAHNEGPEGSDSVLTYRIPCPFLLAIPQRTIGSGWNLRSVACSSRYCARVICRGRNRWLLSGTRFHRAGQCSFEARIISKNLWPSRSPDLTCPNFFPLGNSWSSVQE